jgi:hypothetical protein
MTDNVSGDYQASQMTVGRSAVRSITATTASLERSAVQHLNSDAVTAERTALGVVQSSTAELRESAAGVVAGDYVRVENSRVVFLLAPRVNGNMKVLLTVPSALAVGAGFFLARWLVPLLFGRSRR